MEPTLASLEKRLQLSAGELKKVVLGCPTLLGLSWEDNIEPTLASLEKRLELSAGELKKVVLGQPTLLGYSWQDNMEPTLTSLANPDQDYFSLPSTRANYVVREFLHFSPAELKKVVLRCPTLLGMSWQDNMEPTL